MSGSLATAPVILAHEPAFVLGQLAVKPDTREVNGPGLCEVLEPRVMQVLVALHRAGGQVVTRDDLTASCWDGRVVGDDAINRVISRLRRLAEPNAFAIETITKVGYRLRHAAAGAPAAMAAPVIALPKEKRPRSWGRLAAGGLAVAALLIALIVWAPWRSAPPLPPDVARDFDRAVAALQRDDDDGVTQAIDLLQGVVSRAPDYADGWALLGRAYFESQDYLPPDAQDGALTRARAALERAQALDPENGRAKVVEALLLVMIGHWAEADRLQSRAVEAMPGDPAIQQLRAVFMTNVGRRAEAVAWAERAALLDQDKPRVVAFLAYIQATAGQLEEADRTMARAVKAAPRNPSVFFTRFWIDVFFGRARDALARIRDPDARPIGIPAEDFLTNELAARAFAGRAPGDVSAAIANQRAVAAQGMGYAKNAILVLASLGDLDGAFAVADAIYLDRGSAIAQVMFSRTQGEFNVRNRRPTFALFEPATAAMRSDPRFVPIAEGLGLGDYWRTSGRWPDFCAAEPATAAVCAQLRSGP